jgi:hypothetical protein
MANVPLSMNQLEQITEIVARDLLEQWAIDDRFTEDQLEKATQDAVDDTAFVINQFMSLLNEVMLTTAEQSKLI